MKPQINDKVTSDVVLLLVENDNDLKLYAHKAVLARHSDYFRSRFSERWVEGREEGIATIDTTGKGGITKYVKFFQFIYMEPIQLASLDLHTILDTLEIASELLCSDIVNACDHFLASVYWPDAKVIGARLMSLVHKFKCSEELARRLVEYGHPGHLSTLRQKAADVWRNGARFNDEWTKGFTNFTSMVLTIVPEEFVAYTILPEIFRCKESHLKMLLLNILDSSLSRKADASHQMVIAKELVRFLRKKTAFDKVVVEKLNQLVRKLGGVEQWEVFMVWAEEGKFDGPNLQPSWSKFCQQFSHLPAVQDAAMKDEHFAYLTKLVMEMVPGLAIRKFAWVYENLRWEDRIVDLKEEQLVFTVCSDVLEQITTGKLLLDTPERFTLAKHVMALMSTSETADKNADMDFAITAAKNLHKLFHTLPAEDRCDLWPEEDEWPNIGDAFGPLEGLLAD